MPAAAPTIVTAPGGRAVGYRRLGAGPAVVLLHESPRSSAALLPLAWRLQGRCTVFALDNPGFGLSDALAQERPEAEDFADALMETLDALGLDRVPLYGTHTGAAIALVAAHRHPDRVSRVLLDGYPIFTPAEQAAFLASYLQPLRPDWDGTFLAWLWGRVKDQFTFFPWCLRGEAARLPRPLPGPDVLQGVVADFLAAGDRYRAAYASAFRFDPLAPLTGLGVPALFTARSDDLLFPHLDRLPAGCAVARLGPDRDAWGAAIGDFLAQDEGRPPPPEPRPTLPSEGEARRLTVAADGSVIGLQVRGSGRPLVLLPPIPGSAAGSDGLVRALARRRRVLALDPPGFGASSGLSPGRAFPDLAREALVALGVEAFDVVAIGESVGLAAGLVPPAGTLVALAPVPDEARAGLAEAFPDLAPRPDGGHLLAAWHCLRDGELWRPWTARDPGHARRFGPEPDPARLHAVLADWMRGGTAGASALSAALAAPLRDLLAPLAGRATVIDHSGHPWAEATRRVAEAAGTAFLEAPEGPGLAGAVLSALEARR